MKERTKKEKRKLRQKTKRYKQNTNQNLHYHYTKNIDILLNRRYLQLDNHASIIDKDTQRHFRPSKGNNV